MRVWITRSEPGASRVARHLADAGYQSVVAPVLAVDTMGPPAGFGGRTVQDAIFLSEHAVESGVGILQREGVPLGGIRTFSVGPQTASRLADFGVRALVPAVATSEGLLAMEELSAVAGREVVVFAGEGGRERLCEGLTARGAEVFRLALYRRRRVPPDDLRGALESTQIQAIAVSSGDGFEAVAKAWFAVQGRADIPVFTPSVRVREMGGELGFSRVFACFGAHSQALIEGLARFEE